jgi:CheY-like chemotaxis protein
MTLPTTILTVDNDDLDLRVLSRVLENAGYRVLSAASTSEAIELCRNELRIDLAILDTAVPGLSGEEFQTELFTSRCMRVLFMSGNLQESVRESGCPVERANFLAKPFTTAVLLDRLDRALR